MNGMMREVLVEGDEGRAPWKLEFQQRKHLHVIGGHDF